MSPQRKQDSAECKARVALAALKGRKTVNAFASPSGVHPTPMAHWKQRLQKEMPDICSARRAQRAHDHEAFPGQRSQPIGQLKGEWDWVKKKAGLGSCSPTGVARAGASPASSRASVRPGGVAPIHLFRPSTGGECRASHVEAVAG
jgi:hypothetical protein